MTTALARMIKKDADGIDLGAIGHVIFWVWDDDTGASIEAAEKAAAELEYIEGLNKVVVEQNTELQQRITALEAERDALVEDNKILVWRLGKVIEVEQKWRANVAVSGMGFCLELLNELRGILKFVVVKQDALGECAG